jgi:UDP-N-acetylmuramoylalanine--D-glutamate ligase
MKETLPSLRNRRVLVFGLGGFGGGVGTVRWLLRRGAEVVISDRRSAAELRGSLAALSGLRFELHLGAQSPHLLKDIDVVVANPGVPRDHPVLRAANRKGIIVVNIASLFFASQEKPTIGVTGTRGKSSTVGIIGALLRANHRRVACVGQPGVSLLDFSLRKAEVIVAELSSWQLEGLPAVQRGPHVAVVTNLSPDHLNRYRSMREYADAKKNILRFQTTKDFAVLPFDDDAVRSWSKITKAGVAFFSTKKVPPRGVGIRQGWFVERQGSRTRRLIPLSMVSAEGEHTRANIAASLAAVMPYRLPPEEIATAMKNIPVLPGRQQIVGHVRERLWVNDTTATSPEGVRAALSVLPRPITLIAGGQGKNVSLKELAKLISTKTQALVLLPGSASDELLRLLPKNFLPSVVRVQSMQSAVTAALARSQPGSTVVLSPGAASFNLFRHEFDRGDQFVAEVKKLERRRYAKKR